jgi:hypothetical protein
VASISLTPGTHTIRLVAVWVSGSEYDIADVSGTITTVAYSPQYFKFQLPWTIGGTSVNWVLYNGTTPTDCTTAGVTTVYVDFKNLADNSYVYNGDGDPHDCAGQYGPPIVYSYLRPGTYEVFTWATSGTTGYTFLSPNTGPTINVTAGLFPPASPPQVTLNMVH